MPNASGEVFVAPGDWGREALPPVYHRSANRSTAGSPRQPHHPDAVDTGSPHVAKHPPKLVRTHRRKARGTFRFRAEAGVTFVCKVDRGLLQSCGRRISRRFAAGRHMLQVRARDQAGNVERKPAVFRFRVKRVGG